MNTQPGRNDPCPCGSGRKFKKCCVDKMTSPPRAPQTDPSELVALLHAGRFAELENRVHLLLQNKPDWGIGWKLLGTALGVQGKNALPALQQAIRFLPNDAEVHFNLGLALQEQRQLDAAAASFHRVLALTPKDADAHNELGNVLQELGQHEAAVASYRRALVLNPKIAEAYNKLGCVLHDLRKFDEAVGSYRLALSIDPDNAEVHNNLGYALQSLGWYDEALQHYRQALALAPAYVVAHNNVGNVLQELGQLNAAIASFQQALSIKPDYAEAHYNLGNTLQRLGQVDTAIAHYRRALALKPSFIDAHSNLLFLLNSVIALPSTEYLEQARQYGQKVAQMVVARFDSWCGAPAPERLRVGFVSGDLRNHAVAFFLENFLSHLDRQHVELIAYPTCAKFDEITSRIKPLFSAWRPLFHLNDADAANFIHADGVHILIDLSGHTGHNRLPLFAWKPAPVQVSWLGYFASTGVAEIDYFMADEVGVPMNQRDHFTERVWYLPNTRFCFSPPQVELPVTALPALKNDFITFGSFQNLSKISDVVMATWSKLLEALPDARLRLANKQLGDMAVATQFTLRLQQQGIDLSRVDLHGAMSRADYLAAHAEVDVMLDTFPYPGGTTTCEALWMGVPTITLAGSTLLARQGASILRTAGLDEWIAKSESEYIEKAIIFARDLPKLAELRSGLRTQISSSPLFDAKLFARNFEAALWSMWQTWREKQ